MNIHDHLAKTWGIPRDEAKRRLYKVITGLYEGPDAELVKQDVEATLGRTIRNGVGT